VGVKSKLAAVLSLQVAANLCCEKTLGANATCLTHYASSLPPPEATTFQLLN
jgi:hypothetical protein